MRDPVEPLPLLTTGQAALRYGVHRDTVWDWITTGVISRDGRMVKLHALKVGGRWKTKQEWLDAFLAACQGDGREVASPIRKEEARARRIRRQ